MMNLTTLRISWRPPPADGINGILKGFQIVILGSGAKYNRNITTNERAASVTLFHLVPGMSYSIRVAAKSNAGVGVFTDVQRVTMGKYKYSILPKNLVRWHHYSELLWNQH
ncbi:Roundabout -like protein 2 [Toxocara canis]|uniref:Roundabout-like protein 2 n=1 Tax=Toxocara canis TaxID=6265 RepID=A0A0B2VSC3_TOXCA|nr:Roundabout -like protein 2 [Toxocara canis]